jgi:ABC-type nickel/cobalt efflux system permease component RcnA
MNITMVPMTMVTITMTTLTNMNTSTTIVTMQDNIIWQRYRSSHEHEHLHDHRHGHPHRHEHHHMHDHEHGHSHLPPGTDGSPVTWRSLLGLGISGGLLPCPSALVLLLTAVSLNRAALGMVLVVAFSLGLAGVSTTVGLLFVKGSRLVRQLPRVGTWSRLLPAASALVIMMIGLWLTMDAMLRL